MRGRAPAGLLDGGGVKRLYERHVLPRLIHAACGTRPIYRQRRKVVPAASGRVLEIGFGSGRNLPFYEPGQVRELLALEPSAELIAMARPAISTTGIPVTELACAADAIPLSGQSVDTIVLTYTLCSIREPRLALSEMHRVLKPGGRLLFIEHGAAPDISVRRWQGRVNPLWRRLSGGCRLDLEPPRELAGSGFAIGSLETLYLPGWRPATFNYWGWARRA